MVKHKLNDRGFLLVEMMVVFIVLAVMVLINLQISNNAFKSNLFLKERNILVAQLNSAKQEALNSKGAVHLKFNKRSLFIQSSKDISEYSFKSIYFNNTKELYFNKNGVLNQGYTILFKHGYQYYKLIFYLGKGWFKIE